MQMYFCRGRNGCPQLVFLIVSTEQIYKRLILSDFKIKATLDWAEILRRKFQA